MSGYVKPDLTSPKDYEARRGRMVQRLTAFLGCLLLGHRPQQGAPTLSQATLVLHTLDGRTVKRLVDVRCYNVRCARCGRDLPARMTIDQGTASDAMDEEDQ